MAVAYNSRIVTNGLVLCLDAANRKSYPGSGNIWYDISGNRNHFTLYNTPSFANNALSFDGVNEYAASTNNLNLTSYESITVEVWFRQPTTSAAMVIEHTTDWNTQVGGWGLYTHSTGGPNSINLMHTNYLVAAATSFGRNYDFVINTNWNTQTNIFTRVSDSTGRLAYGNGNLLPFNGAIYSASTTTAAGGSFANAILYLSTRGGTSAYMNGSISKVKIYGNKLSADQVRQNFNATRGRFGV